jgi:hypothetical protein
VHLDKEQNHDTDQNKYSDQSKGPEHIAGNNPTPFSAGKFIVISLKVLTSLHIAGNNCDRTTSEMRGPSSRIRIR